MMINIFIMGRKGPPVLSVTNDKEVFREMVLMRKENEYALKVTDQVHIHLPSSAFTNEASNFWFGVVVGAGLLLAVLASTANQ
jgi:hypothetical protein